MDLQTRLAEHLLTVHNWQVSTEQRKLMRSARLAEWHALEHRTGAGQAWSGWQEHGHADTELEATAR